MEGIASSMPQSEGSLPTMEATERFPPLSGGRLGGSGRRFGRRSGRCGRRFGGRRYWRFGHGRYWRFGGRRCWRFDHGRYWRRSGWRLGRRSGWRLRWGSFRSRDRSALVGFRLEHAGQRGGRLVEHADEFARRGIEHAKQGGEQDFASIDGWLRRGWRRA